MQTMSTNRAKFSLGYHIIWYPKYRHQVLKDAIERAARAHSRPFKAELAELSMICGKELATQFNRFPKLKSRKFCGSGLWSRGTYYTAVGHITEDAVRRYIETQKSRE